MTEEDIVRLMAAEVAKLGARPAPERRRSKAQRRRERARVTKTLRRYRYC